MDPKDYQHRGAGVPLQHPNGYWYFRPDPLPPSLHWTADLISTLGQAERNLGQLASLEASRSNLTWIVGPFIRREAVVSTRIEGTRASLSDLYTYETQLLSALDPGSDAGEVYNYVQALNFGLERSHALPVSLRLFREIHARLMAQPGGSPFTPGQFRRSQNWIGPPGCTLENAPYVPPPVDQMRAALNQLETYIHAPSELPALVQVALIHYQFEALHPFLDGNGRVGRILISLLLHAWGLLPQPILNLSAYFESHRREYYHRLLAVSQRGHWGDWLQFFLEAVSTQSADAVQRISRLQGLYASYVQQVSTERAARRLVRTLDYIFERPLLTIRQVEKALQVPYLSAARYVDKLVQLGILREVTGQARNRIFRADEIIRAIETAA